MTAPAARRTAAFLFVSGLCAVAYQTVWLRHLRLVFGASTPASAAVLAVFMAGLGAGSLVLGKVADRSANPLRLYARLEMAIAALAAASPWLIAAVRAAYVGLGGTPALGSVGGTLVRLALASLVLGPPTFLMGGTLPAAIRAAAATEDRGRRALGLLYGANTLGAVTGALLVTFLAVEFLGIRKSILVAALLNLLLAVVAGAVARQTIAPAVPAEDEPAAPPAGDDDRSAPSRFVLSSAALVGFAFFLMELVWYRMLGPILGGSSYTFGLILAVALAGIGIGGLIYGRGASERRPTLAAFAITCALEALVLALPYALGDRLAFAALVARGFAAGGFVALAAGWAAIAAIVVLPAAIVAGYQFPLLAGILGSGREAVGRDVGRLYAWNTAGAIAGSLAGGFGLLPLVGALGAWRLAVAGLALLGLSAAWIDGGAAGRRRLRLPATLAATALVALATTGPTAAWRHSGIGAGRFSGEWASPNALRSSLQGARSSLAWEADGRESSVAVRDDDGHSFYINGKSDGNALRDAATQVMGGLVGSLLHPDPRSAMVIGLGTGSTAGWLAAVPSIERVDVAEIEPAILRVAADCAAVNQACLRNPKVHVEIGDARELLQVGGEPYDIIFSEPSNPYRAGISSLFTVEFYRAAAARLRPRGMFLQWLQGYEIDAEVVRTAFATLSSVLPQVEAWQLHGGDLLLVASTEPIVHDLERTRRRALEEPYRSALARVWGVSGAEGFYGGFLATSDLARRLREQAGAELSTDDRPRIEFGFIRNLGRPGLLQIEDVRHAARGLRPATVGGELDWNLVEERRRARSLIIQERPAPWPDADSPAGLRNLARIAYAEGESARAAALWLRQAGEPEARADLLLVAAGLAAAGDPLATRYLERLRGEQATEALALQAAWRAARGERAAAVTLLVEAFTAYRGDPWPHPPVMNAALNLALRLAAEDRAAARELDAALAQPFAVAALERRRLLTRVGIADVSRDGALCRAALAPLERAPPWDRLILEARVRCYGTEGELAGRAARDLERYRAAEPRPLLGGGS
jgi:spermidine synthase